MKIEASILVEAPPDVVFRFYTSLDHLRYISPQRRREWCPRRNARIALGAEYEVKIHQGRHAILLRFRTVRYEPGAVYEDEFLNWPLKGARHRQTFSAANGRAATRVDDANLWEPPWYARAMVKKHEWEQTRFFEEKLNNAKRVIEAVYSERGEAAFANGVEEDARAVGIQPIIRDEEMNGRTP